MNVACLFCLFCEQDRDSLEKLLFIATDPRVGQKGKEYMIRAYIPFYHTIERGRDKFTVGRFLVQHNKILSEE